MFLPYYHIENAFLHPKAIEIIAKKVLMAKAPGRNEIEAKMIEFARQQINHTISLYVKSEIYFKAGNFDLTPKLNIDSKTTIPDITKAIINEKAKLLAKYDADFSDLVIESRLTYWKETLENSIKSGWSDNARKYFIGKRVLKEVQVWLFGTKNISIWEHVVESPDPECKLAIKELIEIVNKV